MSTRVRGCSAPAELAHQRSPPWPSAAPRLPHALPASVVTGLPSPPTSSGRCGPSCRPRSPPSSSATWYVWERFSLLLPGERLHGVSAGYRPGQQAPREGSRAAVTEAPGGGHVPVGAASLPGSRSSFPSEKSVWASGSDRGCRDADERGVAPALVSHDTGTRLSPLLSGLQPHLAGSCAALAYSWARFIPT